MSSVRDLIKTFEKESAKSTQQLAILPPPAFLVSQGILPSSLLLTATQPLDANASKSPSLVHRLSSKLSKLLDPSPEAQNGVFVDLNEESDESDAQLVGSDDEDDITRLEAPLDRRRRLMGSSEQRTKSPQKLSFISTNSSTASLSRAMSQLQLQELTKLVTAMYAGRDPPQVRPADTVFKLLNEHRDEAFPQFLVEGWRTSEPLRLVNGGSVARPTANKIVVLGALALYRVLQSNSLVAFVDTISEETFADILAAGVGGPFSEGMPRNLEPGHLIVRTWESKHFLLQQILFCSDKLRCATVIIFTETLAEGRPAPEDVFEGLIHMAYNPLFRMDLVDCAHKSGSDFSALTRTIRDLAGHAGHKELDAQDFFDRVEECLYEILLDLPMDAIENLPKHERALVLKGLERGDE